MTDFLLELFSEEIPARMQAKACEDLARLFAAELAKAGLTATAIETHATPRRLALIARGLPEATAATSDELKGPRADAPPQAIAGFLGKTGLAREQLVERMDAKSTAILFAIVERPGRATPAVLADAIAAVVAGFPWPKSMRWGAASASTASLRWVRPLRGIVALFGEAVVPVTIDGIAAGAATVGHRFHHPGAITIGSAADYEAKLRACHVILDAAERQAIVREGAAAAAAAGGLALVPDEGLVAENAGLTEWPVPLLGRFDPAFLSVPREVIQLTMRTNQKYFACTDAQGALAPAFVCTANIDAVDGGAAIVAGNAKVLAARLADARFFWEQDLRVPLAEQARKLDRIVFHEKLGTVADKAARVAKLARWLVEEGIVKPLPLRGGAGVGDAATGVPGAADLPHPPTLSPEGEGEAQRLADLAEQAALLCKADLVTGMVGEFPELQGIMGGYYARAEGLPDQVADAIREHYGVNAKQPVGIALALADRLDTLISFFDINERPTGSRDPFALRRAGLGIIVLLLGRNISVDLRRLTSWSVIEFLVERWKFQNKEAGGRPDFIDAVISGSQDGDLLRNGLRMRALEAFIATDDGATLLAGYKRAANILRIEEKRDGVAFAPVDALSYVPLPEEALLLDALGFAEQAAAAAVAAEDFAAAMQALAALRPAIDAFFEQVTVNDPDPAKRTARLGLLVRIRDAVHRVADFSRIEG